MEKCVTKSPNGEPMQKDYVPCTHVALAGCETSRPSSGGETIKATSRPLCPAVWWRNTADENENNPGISYPSSYGPLGGRHSVLGVAREPAARCPVRFGWRTPSCSTAHCSAYAPGFSINFDANEPSHGAARFGFSISFDGSGPRGAFQPSGDRTIQPTRGIARHLSSPTNLTWKRRARAATSAVPNNTCCPQDNAAS
jgi:hypothetical protein